MIRVIRIDECKRVDTLGGTLRRILIPTVDGTKVDVAIREVKNDSAYNVPLTDMVQLVYVMSGSGGQFVYKIPGIGASWSAKKGGGVYVEPSEELKVVALRGRLVLLHIQVPKHPNKPLGLVAEGEPPRGYAFAEEMLRVLVDENRMRQRTFWVNKETGLSDSWDMQIGRMVYKPDASSPRHVHNATATNPDGAEHFYLIEQGVGRVLCDGYDLSVGPGTLVFIPAGEWHQLAASGTGFEYIEFQAPFDFATTMDHDPLGKNWYILGTDDGTGKLQLWVQS